MRNNPLAKACRLSPCTGGQAHGVSYVQADKPWYNSFIFGVILEGNQFALWPNKYGKDTRIPRNAVFRLPALRHKKEVNLKSLPFLRNKS